MMDEDRQLLKQIHPVRIVIVSAYELVCAGLRAMLTGAQWLAALDEALDDHSALELCRKLQPDIVLLDVSMPDSEGLPMLHLLQELCAQTKVIILIMDERSDYLLAAQKA